MSRVLLIGDIHGKLNEYKEVLNKNVYDISYQIGDFGFQKEYDEFNLFRNKEKDFVLMGNHDYYPYVLESFSKGHWFYDDHGIFGIRGASSVDKSKRIVGRDWFEEEELNYLQMRDVIENYSKLKPEIVITHDCPQFVCEQLFNIKDHSNTRLLLNELYEIHQPKLWFFGHHHKSVTYKRKKTRFRCLSELENVII